MKKGVIQTYTSDNQSGMREEEEGASAVPQTLIWDTYHFCYRIGRGSDSEKSHCSHNSQSAQLHSSARK